MRKGEREPEAEPPLRLSSFSNGEYLHEATAHERAARRRILAEAGERARRVGLDRRSFLRSAMGMAGSLLALNCGRPSGYTLHEETTCDEALASHALAGDELIIDLQTHHVDPYGSWRSTNAPLASFLALFPQARCAGEPDYAHCLSAKQYIQSIFLESDTSVAVLSGLPAEACHGQASSCGEPITNPQIAATRELVNGLARAERVLAHCMVLPNVPGGLDAMDQAQGISAWKCYTPWGPQGRGFSLVDPLTGLPFIEKGRRLGVKIFCCHKGIPLPGFDKAHTGPLDLVQAARAYPDCAFVAYHSALDEGSPDAFTHWVEGPFGPARRGIDSLIHALLDEGLIALHDDGAVTRAPGLNVYAELGSVWGRVMTNPAEAVHVLGKLLRFVGEDNVVWGTDSLWTGSPQPQLEAFRAFQIAPEDQERYGYPALTAQLKAKVLGLNAARLFGIDPAARRCSITQGQLQRLKQQLDGEFGLRRHQGRPLPGPSTRREFLAFSRLQKGPG